LGLDTSTAWLYGTCMTSHFPIHVRPVRTEKPLTPAEAFDPQRPLPDELVAGIAHDYAMQDQAARYEELLDALEEALKDPVPRAYARIVRLVREVRA
jgi:hypothetical protein